MCFTLEIASSALQTMVHKGFFDPPEKFQVWAYRNKQKLLIVKFRVHTAFAAATVEIIVDGNRDALNHEPYLHSLGRSLAFLAINQLRKQ